MSENRSNRMKDSELTKVNGGFVDPVMPDAMPSDSHRLCADSYNPALTVCPYLNLPEERAKYIAVNDCADCPYNPDMQPPTML